MGNGVMSDVERMLSDIEFEVQATEEQIGRPALNPRVMSALRQVPREEFVPPESRLFAYGNHPLPIGHSQTISQPYIVALMTDLLAPKAEDVILEVGTGSGYQAAVLSQLVKQVYSLEIIDELAKAAATRLQRLGYNNVSVRAADGYYGWREYAPFDGIIVTAAAAHIPPALIEQLKPGGRLVIPVGMPHMYQELVVVEKDKNGKISERRVLGVAFVPLTGDHISLETAQR